MKLAMTAAEKESLILSLGEKMKVHQKDMETASKKQKTLLTDAIKNLMNRIDETKYTDEDFKKIILNSFMESLKVLCENSKNFKSAHDAFQFSNKKTQDVWECMYAAKHFHVVDKKFTVPEMFKNKASNKIIHFHQTRIISNQERDSFLRMLDNAFVELHRIIVGAVVSCDHIERKQKTPHNGTKRNKYNANSITRDMLIEFYRCGRKRFFTLEKDAEAEAKIASQEVNSDINSYACKYCSAFHIGHTSASNYRNPSRQKLIETWNDYSSKNHKFLLEQGVIQ